MLNTIHLEANGKTARVLYQSLPNLRPKPQLRSITPSGEVVTNRILNGVNPAIDPFQVTVDSFLAEDPELVPETAGEVLDPENLSTAYFDPATPEPSPVADFHLIDIVYDPAGEEKERRPHVNRQRNLDDIYPVKVGKKMPLENVLTGFVFKQIYQLVHEDGLTKDFLFEIARVLQDNHQMAVLGAGPKGNQPLVIREKGGPFRGFLYGETGSGEDEGKYKLLLMLTDQELKRPAAKEEA